MRALDLSQLLMRTTAAAGPRPSAGIAAAEAQAAYDTFEASLRRELRTRAAADGADVAALVRQLSELSLRTGTRAEQERFREAIRPLARRLAGRVRHRRRGGRPQLDLRRTFARSVGTGAVPVELYHHRRQGRRPTLFVLADVSGSMVDYSTFTLDLLRALTSEIAALRCFAFVDGTAVDCDLRLRRVVGGAGRGCRSIWTT